MNVKHSQTERVKDAGLVKNIYEVELLFSTFGISYIVMLGPVMLLRR